MVSSYTKRKMVYFAVCSSIPQLSIKISWRLIFFPIGVNSRREVLAPLEVLFK